MLNSSWNAENCERSTCWNIEVLYSKGNVVMLKCWQCGWHVEILKCWNVEDIQNPRSNLNPPPRNSNTFLQATKPQSLKTLKQNLNPSPPMNPKTFPLRHWQQVHLQQHLERQQHLSNKSAYFVFCKSPCRPIFFSVFPIFFQSSNLFFSLHICSSVVFRLFFFQSSYFFFSPFEIRQFYFFSVILFLFSLARYSTLGRGWV